MGQSKSVLVVGADSFIGNALMFHLTKCGYNAVGTTVRRPPSPTHHSSLFLDLRDPCGWRAPQVFEAAVICAGITKGSQCTKDPEGSAQVNVIGTLRILNQLVQNGSFVILLSSNQVFDGWSPYPTPTDRVCPKTEYGRQKADLEGRVMGHKSVAILRLTKVFPPMPPILVQWLKALRNGEPIHPFSDLPVAPVSSGDATELVLRVIGAHSSGIHHLSGDRDITYQRIAEYVASAIGASTDLIRPVRAECSRDLCEYVPQHTTLDCRQTFLDLHINPIASWQTVENSVSTCVAEK